MYKRVKSKKYILISKEAVNITRNKLCVYLIVTYLIRIKVQKEKLNVKYVNMIYPVTGWFEITQYDDKRVISIFRQYSKVTYCIGTICIYFNQEWIEQRK